MLTDVDPFAAGATQHYDSLGFMWLTPLDNTDLGVTLSATYHVDCTEHVVRRRREHPRSSAGGLGRQRRSV